MRNSERNLLMLGLLTVFREADMVTLFVRQPSLAEWLMGTLQEAGPQTLDELGQRLPHTNWAQLLLAVDHLSRNGHISMNLIDQGNYLLSRSQTPEAAERAWYEYSAELVAATKS
jgi:hypothetical protein